jgi:hypothetical protein
MIPFSREQFMAVFADPEEEMDGHSREGGNPARNA